MPRLSEGCLFGQTLVSHTHIAPCFCLQLRQRGKGAAAGLMTVRPGFILAVDVSEYVTNKQNQVTVHCTTSPAGLAGVSRLMGTVSAVIQDYAEPARPDR